MIEPSNIFESHRAELLKLWCLLNTVKNPSIDYIVEKVSGAIVGTPIILHPSLEKKYIKMREQE